MRANLVHGFRVFNPGEHSGIYFIGNLDFDIGEDKTHLPQQTLRLERLGDIEL